MRYRESSIMFDVSSILHDKKVLLNRHIDDGTVPFFHYLITFAGHFAAHLPQFVHFS